MPGSQKSLGLGENLTEEVTLEVGGRASGRGVDSAAAITTELPVQAVNKAEGGPLP